MTVHHTPTAPVLDLRLPAGRVEVSTADVVTTTVELTLLAGDGGDEAIAATREELVPDGERQRLVVHVPERRGRIISLRREPEIELRVTAPIGTRVDVSTIAADVHVRGEVSTVNCKTVSGDASVERVDGDASVRSTSGDVTVGTVRGVARLQSMSGDVRADHGTARVEAKSMSGNVAVGRVGGSIEASSMSGDIDVGSVRVGTADLSTMSGDVRVAVERGSRVYLDLKTLSGDASSDLAMTDQQPAEEGVELTVRASTKSGDVIVRRAPERAAAGA